jgi:hypothetical protein
VTGEMRPHKGLFPGVGVPWSVLGRRASIREMRGNKVQRVRERGRGRGEKRDMKLTETLKLMT